MSISFKKSMLAVTLVSALTAGFSGIAAAKSTDHVPTAPITEAASTPGNPLWLVADRHNGGHHHDHGGWGHSRFPHFMLGFGNDGMYQDWPTECSGLAWRLEHKHVPYWKEQAILANRGCV